MAKSMPVYFWEVCPHYLPQIVSLSVCFFFPQYEVAAASESIKPLFVGFYTFAITRICLWGQKNQATYFQLLLG